MKREIVVICFVVYQLAQIAFTSPYLMVDTDVITDGIITTGFQNHYRNEADVALQDRLRDDVEVSARSDNSSPI